MCVQIVPTLVFMNILVQWEGCPVTAATWEPQENFRSKKTLTSLLREREQSLLRARKHKEKVAKQCIHHSTTSKSGSKGGNTNGGPPAQSDRRAGLPTAAGVMQVTVDEIVPAESGHRILNTCLGRSPTTPVEQPLPHQEHANVYGKGFAMLARLGWMGHGGLGKSGKSVATPVAVTLKKDLKGLMSEDEALVLKSKQRQILTKQQLHTLLQRSGTGNLNGTGKKKASKKHSCSLE
jgi:G-patch domain